MEKIIISERVAQQVERLVDILFDEGYFAIKENAEKYAGEIKNFISTIPQRQRSATNHKSYGAWFCRYKPNKHTTWYVTFDTDESTWLIKDIFNNHGSDYATFLRSVMK